MLSAVAAGLTMSKGTVSTSILFATRQAYSQMKAEEPEIKIVRDRVTDGHGNHRKSKRPIWVRVKHVTDYFLIRRVVEANWRAGLD